MNWSENARSQIRPMHQPFNLCLSPHRAMLLEKRLTQREN